MKAELSRNCYNYDEFQTKSQMALASSSSYCFNKCVIESKLDDNVQEFTFPTLEQIDNILEKMLDKFPQHQIALSYSISANSSDLKLMVYPVVSTA